MEYGSARGEKDALVEDVDGGIPGAEIIDVGLAWRIKEVVETAGESGEIFQKWVADY